MSVDTVASVIYKNGRFLMVEEQTSQGIRFNQPAGHVEKGETIIEALIRETREEACVEILPIQLLGIYKKVGKHSEPGLVRHYQRHAFIAEVTEEFPFEHHSPEIIARHWLSLEEILQKQDQLRGPCTLETILDFIRWKKLFSKQENE